MEKRAQWGSRRDTPPRGDVRIVRRIEGREFASKLVEMLMTAPDIPTFHIQRDRVDPGNVAWLWMSARTYDYLEQMLREMKLEGKL